MILKFSFQNEIHRCSEPPLSFAELSTFLANMFKSSLPQTYDLYYRNAEGQNIPLKTEEDYETLKGLDSSKAIKVLIVENGQNSNSIQQDKKVEAEGDYEVIGQANEAEKNQKKEEAQKVPQEESTNFLDKITRDITKHYVLPELTRIHGEIPHVSMVEATVKIALCQTLPTVFVNARDNLASQGLIRLTGNQPMPNQQNQPMPNQQNQQRPQQSISSKIEEKGVAVLGKVWKTLGELPDTAVKLTDKVANQIYRVVDNKPREENKDSLLEENPERREKKGGDFFNTFTNKLLQLPSSTVSFADNLAQKISGDPYVLVEEGKYPKSVVDKANQLKTIFPDQDNKEMLEYIQRLPKEITVEQVASLYADFKKI